MSRYADIVKNTLALRNKSYLKGLTRIDILTAQDAKYVPFAKSLVRTLRKYTIKRDIAVFRRHYRFGDVSIFVSGSQFEQYIRVRTGAPPGNFYVIPVVYKISTDATTEGEPTFLNSTLKKATAVPVDLDAIVSMFPHKAVENRRRTGVNAAGGRGYFSKQSVVYGGDDPSLANYAGIFKHSYIDPSTQEPTTEFLHATATDIVDPTPPSTDGLYYQSSALGDQLISFNDFSIARRPAAHETMFASPDGTKIVTEEWFPPMADASSEPTGFDPFFTLRSIIDVDLGNEETPVVISDYTNLNDYSEEDLNANGSGEHTQVTSSTGTAGVSRSVTIEHSGVLSAPVSTIFNDANEMVHTVAVQTISGGLVSEGTRADGPPVTYEHSLELAYSRVIEITAPNMAPLTVTLDAENLSGSHTYSGGAFTDYNYTGNWEKRILNIMYSSTSIPALIYREAEYTSDIEMQELTGVLEPYATNRIETIRVVAIIGLETFILSEETTTPADGFLGAVNLSDMSGVTVAISSSWDPTTNRFMTLPSVGTVSTTPFPDGNIGNVYFRGERRQGPIPEYMGLSGGEYSDLVSSIPPDVAIPGSQALFAAQSPKIYIGSVYTIPTRLVTFPPDESEYTWSSFSHNDVALKKTIVNHVLAPEEPIIGAALDDYKIWFTLVRAI